MNDSHLAPPDYPEPPEWYLAIEDAALDQEVPQALGTAILKLLEDWCGSQSQSESDPGPEPVVELPDDYFKGPEKCPHGNEWHNCDACDHASDIAYDTARERK